MTKNATRRRERAGAGAGRQAEPAAAGRPCRNARQAGRKRPSVCGLHNACSARRTAPRPDPTSPPPQCAAGSTDDDGLGSPIEWEASSGEAKMR